MKTLLKILRAAHCRSTHHFFAVDALPLVQTEAGKRLAGWLLRYHNRYLTGAKDPDTRFRDFQNHVIHVNDGYWGGAPRVAHQWYDRLQRYLREERMSDAAHAAGVLSHYFTDPIMPLHTAQSERESVLHRPIEWSVTKSYETIYRQWKDDHMRVVFQMADGDGWLGEAILHAARFANRKYDPLMDEYRLDKGVKDPPSGLNEKSRSALAELFGLSITGWARVIERAAQDAEANQSRKLPETGLTMPTLLATIRIPDRWWLRRIESIEERKEVQAIVEEFRTTGKLVENLPSEIDIKQRVIKINADERRYREERERRATSTETVIEVTPDTQPSQTTPQPQATEQSLPVETEPVTDGAANPFASVNRNPETVPYRRADDPEPVPEPKSPAATTKSNLQFRLLVSDDLVDAPSIGPKTAKRFAKIGIHTVADFVKGDAKTIAKELGTRWITGAKVNDWQWQARLMCTVPSMLARDTQVLVGAGFTTATAIAEADPKKLLGEIKKFAKTTDGKRYLRRSATPTLDDVLKYQVDAKAAISVSRQTQVA